MSRRPPDRAPEPPEPALAMALEDDEPGLTWEEYLERRRELEARLAQVAARLVASRRFPRWFYHASLPPRIVATAAEADALGAGWHVRPT